MPMSASEASSFRGVNDSASLWRRVILKNAPILVLDEATSALDSEVEAAIQSQLDGLMEGRTVIAIAHRLSTIARMDRLVILDQRPDRGVWLPCCASGAKWRLRSSLASAIRRVRSRSGGRGSEIGPMARPFAPPDSEAESGMPVWPLLATVAVQTLATMALYSMPTLAPAVARDLHVNGALVGGFVATAYGVGIVSALLSPGLIRRYGGVRATQAVLLAAVGMLADRREQRHVAGIACAAVVLGCGYGAAAPASTHLLVPHTPRAMFNLVMSLRQIGVPLGGVFAALTLPPLVAIIGWRGALLAELVPVVCLILLMEVPAPHVGF